MSSVVLLTFCRFGVVGASGVVVNTAVFWLLSRYEPTTVAAAVAFELALLSNFALNHSWTFRREGSAPLGWSATVGQQLLRYQLSALGALLLQLVVLHALIGIGLHPVIANLLGIGAGTGWNFTASVCWTWSSRNLYTTAHREPHGMPTIHHESLLDCSVTV